MGCFIPRVSAEDPNGVQLQEEAQRRLNAKFGEGGLANQVNRVSTRSRLGLRLLPASSEGGEPAPGGGDQGGG